MHFKKLFKLSKRKVTKYSSLSVGVIFIVGILVLLLFPDVYINSYLKDRIIKEFEDVCPGYSMGISDLNFNIMKNRIEFDSIMIKSRDLTFSCSIRKSSLKDIGWLKLIWKGDAGAGIIAEAEGIVVKFRKSQYVLRCERFFISVRDSDLVAFDLKMHPLVEENKFFDESPFRKTRFRLFLPQLNLIGLDFSGLLQGKIYHTRSIKIHDVDLDILVDMYNPCKVDGSKTLMPNELFSSIKEIIQIDSLFIIGGRLKYGELYAARSDPAIVTFDNLHLSANKISNNDHHGNLLSIQAEAIFMKEGTMTLVMHYLLTSSKFSLNYSGSLGPTHLNKLNSFLEIAEHVRLKSGIIHSANYNIHVNDGVAKGDLKIEYEDFKITFLDKHSGSEKATMVMIKSFLANTFKLNSCNKRDDDGVLKLGKVNYSRKKDDVFTQYLWFSLRSSVADIAGF